jgi:hypothetical protein
MNLPNARNARIEREKIIGYLLNTGHAYGSSKARFFTRFGFTPEKWELLAKRLCPVKVNERIEDESDVNEGGEHQVEFLEA